MELRTLPVGALEPNSYNPNTMTAEEFAEVVTEVRHLGRLPKPVVVVSRGARWEIVDGEHGWRAACKVGLQEVLCEVIDTDPFEAMRQTYKRNQHGRHDPIRLGRMFEAMLRTRGLSQRELAAEIGVSEGTIRNALTYATASSLRNSYSDEFGSASEDPDREVAALTVRQAREYVRLPAPVRDEWLDAGADLKALQRAAVVRVVEGGHARTYSLDDPQGEVDFWQELVNTGLAARVTSTDFVASAHEAFRLLFFRRQHLQHLPDLDAYLEAVIDWGLPSSVMDHLPCRLTDGQTEPSVSPEQWSSMLRDCAGRAADPGELVGLLRCSIRLALTDVGLTAREATDPRRIEAQRAVMAAPDFIRDSPLPLADRHYLTLLISTPNVDEGDALLAVSRACRMLEDVHDAAKAQRFGDVPPRLRPLLVEPSPPRAFEIALAEVREERADAEQRALASDRVRLTQALVDLFCGVSSPGLERQATDVTAARTLLEVHLATVPDRELRLLGCAALGWDWGIAAWLEACCRVTE